jgi:hypothetical protein
MLRELADSTGARLAGAISRVLLPLIAVAEVFSWYATLTTSYLGNTIEESLWAFSATLFIVGALSLRRHVDDRHRRILTAAAVIGVGYVAFTHNNYTNTPRVVETAAGDAPQSPKPAKKTTPRRP